MLWENRCCDWVIYKLNQGENTTSRWRELLNCIGTDRHLCNLIKDVPLVVFLIFGLDWAGLFFLPQEFLFNIKHVFDSRGHDRRRSRQNNVSARNIELFAKFYSCLWFVIFWQIEKKKNPKTYIYNKWHTSASWKRHFSKEKILSN